MPRSWSGWLVYCDLNQTNLLSLKAPPPKDTISFSIKILCISACLVPTTEYNITFLLCFSCHHHHRHKTSWCLHTYPVLSGGPLRQTKEKVSFVPHKRVVPAKASNATLSKVQSKNKGNQLKQKEEEREIYGEQSSLFTYFK